PKIPAGRIARPLQIDLRQSASHDKSDERRVCLHRNDDGAVHGRVDGGLTNVRKIIVGFSLQAHTYGQMQPTDDSALLKQFLESRSEDAFTALVERHLNLVYSVALRQSGDAGQAEEISQAVFIILARKAAQLRNDKALSSWLFQTTRLTANNLIRSEMRRRHR